MKTWYVTVPIAGHACVTVEAEDEESAIETAINDASLSDVEEWQALARFHQGNVCYCPSPWEAQANAEEEEEE